SFAWPETVKNTASSICRSRGGRLRRLAFGVWRLAFGVRRLAFGVRREITRKARHKSYKSH
ncbi:MAG TPA: hypothetical protein VF020_12155, partial [Chthoniobacterales bacterium]